MRSFTYESNIIRTKIESNILLKIKIKYIQKPEGKNDIVIRTKNSTD